MHWFKVLQGFAISLILALITSCDTTDPKPPDEKPAGYQEDIPWPSLADSPWPMYRGNPQYTGRSKFSGPNSGVLEWTYDSVSIETGVVIGSDNSVIFQTNNPLSFFGGIYCINSLGELNWKYKIDGNAAVTTPVVLSDSTIIVSSYTRGEIIALSPDGVLKWKFDTGGYITSRGINVGIDGTIYFVDNTCTLYALNGNGEQKWKLQIENPQSAFSSILWMPFSPDSKILYLKGINKAIYAISVAQKSILWHYGGKNDISCPLVDSDGFIYIYGVPDISEGSMLSLTKLSNSGNVVWKYTLCETDKGYFFEPTIDYNGNLYFGSGTDSLYSVNYDGVLRWKIDLKENYSASISSALTCDVQNNIFVPIQGFIPQLQFEVLAFDDSGKILWRSEKLLGASGDSPALGFGGLYFPTFRSLNIYSIK